ncbi:AAA family ATPase [Arachidicoccus sp.]|uniref:AAA family ATPase n=1 Tax=Arachidicoccus sp. TaxID=1872624 RepID=UPI003D1EC9A1
MRRIKIKNFGPIKDGNQANDGWIDIKKVTVFIGNQGSGKSTVAKLISTFMWLEKALIRGDIKSPVSHHDFIELIEYHRLENYLEHNTQIEYEGNTFRLILPENSAKKAIEATKLNQKSVKQPKIMYVPAERNFLSSIANINKVSDLIIGSLKEYSIEFRNAQLAHRSNPIDLPINNTKIVYEPKEDENYLIFNNKRLKLSDASSGFHSIVPLYWVTKYLIEYVKQGEKKLLELLSTDQTIRRNNELKELNTLKFGEKTLRTREKKINEKYVSKYFINIVEEPEQNLFPSSQRQLLNSLLAFNNGNNMLIMTTHSPYLINYISLAVKANELKDKIKDKGLKDKLNTIVPINSTVNPNELVIYELDETNGSVNKLGDFEGIPSDKNFLNISLAQSNQLFDSLLEIEEEL